MDEVLEGAQKYCPERIPNREIKLSSEAYKDKMLVLKREIEKVQAEYGTASRFPLTCRAGMTEDEVNREYMKIHAQFTRAREEMQDIEDEHQVFQ